MGFTGTVIAARSDTPLTEVNGVRSLPVGWHGVGADGWQVVQISRAPVDWCPPMTEADGRDRLLSRLAEETGYPVLAALVLGSDGAQLIGYSARAGRWSGWLSPELVVDHLGGEYAEPLAGVEGELPDDLDAYWRERYDEACLPLYEVAPRTVVAAPAAVAWAVEAGFAPDVDAVAAVLDGGSTFVEAHFLTLLTTLGLPPLA
jgi:hypothetical protein